jgi:predicted SprT family Zn-dependent metalloprotease
MRTRLGEVTVDSRSPRLLEITISRRHWERDGSTEVEKTLLHEMVHQWQAESGLKVDHGASFKRKAREVGVAPLARRAVDRVAATTM